MNHRIALLGGAINKLAICYQQLSGHLNRALEPLGLNMTQMSLLTHLSWDPSKKESVGKLAEVMKMNQPAVTKATKSLMDKGWLTRVKDEHDARVTYLQIAESGVQQLELARSQCVPVLETAFEGLDDNQLQQLINLLSVSIRSFT